MKIKNSLLIFLLLNLTAICFAQQSNADIEIINSGKPLTNEMIFFSPDQFKRNKEPLFYVNDRQVVSIAMFNKDELKKITVLQPSEASKKYGSKGNNGIVLVVLKDEVIKPEILVLTNKLYYKCEIEGQIVDTTESYYTQTGGKNCTIFDLRDKTDTQILYLNFKNKIKIKNLGAGWDYSNLVITGAELSGWDGEYTALIKKEGIVKIVIFNNFMDGTQRKTEIVFKAVKLPT